MARFFKYECELIEGKRHRKAGLRLGKMHIGIFFPMAVNVGVFRRNIFDPREWGHWVYFTNREYGWQVRLLWLAVGWQRERRRGATTGSVAKPLWRTGEDS